MIQKKCYRFADARSIIWMWDIKYRRCAEKESLGLESKNVLPESTVIESYGASGKLEGVTTIPRDWQYCSPPEGHDKG
jgi:hypothetical protein